MIGVIVGSYGITQLLLRIPLGIISDRYDRRKLFVIAGMVLTVVSSFGLWASPALLSVLFFRALSGVAAATWVIFTVFFSSYYAQEEAASSISLINTFCYLGQLMAVFVGGLVASRFGPRSTFLLAGAVGLVGLIISLFIAESKNGYSQSLKPGDLLEVGRKKELLHISILGIFVSFISFATVFGFTPVYAKSIGATNFNLGMLTAFTLLPGVIAAALGSVVFAKRFGEARTIIAGFALIGLSSLVIPSITSLKWLYLAQISGGFSKGLTMSLLMGLSIKNVEPEKRATAMGVFQAVYALGIFAGPFVVGLISDALGLSWGFWLTGVIGLFSAFLSAHFLRGSGPNIRTFAAEK
jgi:MFS family permease